MGLKKETKSYLLEMLTLFVGLSIANLVCKVTGYNSFSYRLLAAVLVGIVLGVARIVIQERRHDHR